MIEGPIQHIIDYYYEPKTEWGKTRVKRVLEALRPRVEDEGRD